MIRELVNLILHANVRGVLRIYGSRTSTERPAES